MVLSTTSRNGRTRLEQHLIVVEDLGNMDATELLPTIPKTDGEGRGMVDLRSMEKKLSVKVVFDDVTGHVYLVGDAKKIDKSALH